MEDKYRREEVMTRIVHKLEAEGTFMEIVESILEDIEVVLLTSHAAIMQISADNNWVDTVISYVCPDDKPMEMTNFAMDKFVIAGDGIKACYTDSCTEDERTILELMGADTSVTVPVYINNACAMYFAVFDTHSCTHYGEDVLKFIGDVANIVQIIAQKKVTKSSLLSSYEVLREILSSIGSGIMVFNRTDGAVLFENDVAARTDEIKRAIQEGVTDYMNMPDEEKKHRKPSEYYDPMSGLWFEIKFSDLTWIDGSPVIVCTAVDTTQKKKNQQKIEYQANNDFLTGLYNRMKCENDLRRVMREAENTDAKGAVMFIDLDDFKHINDGLGHQYGDVLLQQIAAGLQGVPGLRGNCYRMGGDEFLVIIRPEQFQDMERIIKSVVNMFNKPWYLMGTEYYCTMSMGIATFPDNSDDVHDIIKMADVAMYESKKSGKNCYNYYDADKRTNTAKQLDIENNMRQAVASQIQEFVVFYQPVVDTVTKRCVSCEALVRWDSKSLGFMGPGEFIPLAEYLGLITDIGDYILEEACKQCKKWNDAGYVDFHVNVNLSVVQLLQKNVVDNINRIILQSGVNPSNVVLEITESFAINDMDRVLNIIKGLKTLGPRIALDDFGTGYSSLNYIKQLPLNIIKVDKTFIDDIVGDDYAQAFVKLIVDLSKTIGTQIVVEGVEHSNQYELLRELGADYIQGYYFGKPVPAMEFEEKFLGKQLGGDA